MFRHILQSASYCTVRLVPTGHSRDSRDHPRRAPSTASPPPRWVPGGQHNALCESPSNDPRVAPSTPRRGVPLPMTRHPIGGAPRSTWIGLKPPTRTPWQQSGGVMDTLPSRASTRDGGRPWTVVDARHAVIGWSAVFGQRTDVASMSYMCPLPSVW